MPETANIHDLPTPIGQSRPFLDMLAHVSQAAALSRPVLVIGERGTGKELVAGRLALLSPRWNRPFLQLNCAALSDTLLDSELFGHEAGAFTGAARRRPGRFESADGGTLFLDEIATASAAVQEKLLRVIEYGTFERLGGGETLRVDVRVVGATNADLPAMARAGAFRADLLDRLAFDVINVPPLRERREDIPLLAEHFARRMTSELGGRLFAGFTRPAMERVLAHDWPGNVRELRNVIERSVYRARGSERPLAEIVLDPFRTDWSAQPQSAPARDRAPVPDRAAAPDATPLPRDFEQATRAHARSLLEGALAQTRFNQAAAARALGLSYHQFRHLLRAHGVTAREASPDDAAAPQSADAPPRPRSRPRPTREPAARDRAG